jgi:hypothetical protein
LRGTDDQEENGDLSDEGKWSAPHGMKIRRVAQKLRKRPINHRFQEVVQKLDRSKWILPASLSRLNQREESYPYKPITRIGEQ